VTTAEASNDRRALVYQLPWIKGVCVLAVIVIHVTASYPGRAPFDWFTAVLISANSLARFAVPIFVLLSGFYLSLNTRNERSLPFYRRTLKLLVVPYVVYSAGYVMAFPRAAAGFIQAWLWAMLSATAFIHFWFIPVIVGLYLIHPFLRRWYRLSERGARLVVIAFVVQVVWAVVVEFATVLPPTDGWFAPVAVSLSFLSYIGYFALGYFVHDHASEVVQAIRRPVILVVAGLTWLATAAIMSSYLVIPLAGGLTFNAISHRGLAVVLFSPPLSLAALLVLAAWRPGVGLTRPVGWLIHACGLYAYAVYYLHPLVLEIVTWTWIHAVGLGRHEVSFYVVAFPLVSVLTVFLAKLVARLPLARYLA
jgi:surface polysaccharide O-acyltransferase-like enzyme